MDTKLFNAIGLLKILYSIQLSQHLGRKQLYLTHTHPTWIYFCTFDLAHRFPFFPPLLFSFHFPLFLQHHVLNQGL